jgi:hypothetical protein
MSDNLGILITQNLGSPKNRSFAFYLKNVASVKQAGLRGMLKNASKNFCTSPLVITPNPSSSNPSTSSAVETPENKEENPDDPEPEDGYIQMEYSSH